MTFNQTNLLYDFYLLGRKVRGFVKQENKDLIFTASILSILNKRSLSISQIADKLFTKISAVSEKVIELERNGLIGKYVDRDQRKVKLKITVSGEKYLQAFNLRLNRFCSKVFKPLTQKELSQMSTLLKKILGG